MAPENTLPQEEWPTRTSEADPIWQDEYVTLEQEVVYETVPPPPLVTTPPERSNSIGLGLLFGLALVAAVALGVLAAWWLTRPDENRTADTTTVTTRAAAPTVTPATAAATTIVVPALAGLEEQPALDALTKAGLSPKVERRTTGPADGRVFSQHPSGLAKVAPGARVTIIVNPSKSTGTDNTAARPGAVATPRVSKPVAAPQVAKPAAAATATAAAPDPTPAAEARVSTVPDLSGRNEQEAVQALNAAGLVPSIVFVPATDPLGSVMGQAKPSGTKLAAESTVTITISKGPGQNPDESVPDVVGKTLTDALAAVNAEQLRMIFLRKTVATRDQAGKIVRQTPPPGAHAPRNGQVLVYLGAFRAGG